MARTRTSATSSTARGYGQQHRKRREQLLARHVDGTPCTWCDQPMYVDKERNFDAAILEADHSDSLKLHGMSLPDQLLHRRCNRQKREGGQGREHLRPAPAEGHFDWSGLFICT